MHPRGRGYGGHLGRARQRLAGLRTNTLVSLGAAIFVVFESQFTDTSPTRVAAQVVTGIGFLGAGVIWKEGVNVRGMNTATATLWCCCAVGLLAGAAKQDVNLVLRPLVRAINRQPLETGEIETSYIVTVTCRGPEEAQIRALLVQGFGVSDLHLRELEHRPKALYLLTRLVHFLAAVWHNLSPPLTLARPIARCRRGWRRRAASTHDGRRAKSALRRI